MKKFVAMLAAMFVAMLGLTGLASSAVAASNTNGNLTIQATPWPPEANKIVRLTGVVKWNNISGKTQYTCKVWTLTFDGEQITGGEADSTTTSTETTFSHDFTAPANAAARSNTARATCTVSNKLGYGLIDIDPLLTSEVTPTAGPASGGALPSTGGPSMWYLIFGLALVPPGVWLIRRGRALSD